MQNKVVMGKKKCWKRLSSGGARCMSAREMEADCATKKQNCKKNCTAKTNENGTYQAD